MSTKSNLKELTVALSHLEKSGLYDVEKYSHSLLHQTNQLEYFYCHLVKDDSNKTFYHIHNRPHVHQLAYFNIGRGFPKELMDGHWCYVLKDLGFKMLIIPCTSIKEDSSIVNPYFEKDIKMQYKDQNMLCRMQLSDIRSIDVQRLDLRKPFYDVVTDEKEIREFIRNNLFN